MTFCLLNANFVKYLLIEDNIYKTIIFVLIYFVKALN